MLLYEPIKEAQARSDLLAEDGVLVEGERPGTWGGDHTHRDRKTCI